MAMVIPDIGQWVSGFLLPLTHCQAEDFLNLAHSAGQYFELYQQYFPSELACSLQRNRRHGVLPRPGDPYTVFEWQFLKLVHTRLFEMPYWVFEDPVAENRCYGIPIEPNGLPSLYEFGDPWGTAEDMDLGWQLLLYLDNQLSADFFEDVLDIDSPARAIFALDIQKGPLDLPALRARCAQQEEPCAFFPHALDMLAHTTGVAWLDVTYDMPTEPIPWDRETMDELARQWKEGQDILEKASQFAHWLEEDVQAHFQEVVTLWNLSHIKPQEAVTRPGQ